jgi:hypothetical protein
MRSAAVAAVAAVLLAPSAQAQQQISLNWREHLSYQNRPIMSFRVDEIQLRANSWSVRAKYTNLSKVNVTYVKNVFNLGVWTRVTATCKHVGLPARRFVPPIPATLRPGRSWSGVISGSGRPPPRAFLRFVFALFRGPPNAYGPHHSFGWITDHVYDLAHDRSYVTHAERCR